MKYCPECGTVNGHHPNCPEADDWDETEEEEQEE
jgi:hypothetical protein|tara:strand:+ start:227 stop:328 length:102 start_codon:yes stop_codon:yes gene_type:complete